ncbi:MAG TPA: hypothetical protein VGQ45_09820 [Gaiellales bacterium]|jgi:hypothetical protein|nr:hypothetical protein [Gaiellales bacterium]
MPSELERRLERALTDVPVEASSDAHDRARGAALAAAAAPGRGSQWRAVIAAVVAMVLVTTGVTLAATGERPFSDTATLTKPPQAARPHTGLLPRASRAFSILAGGRAWVAIPHRVLLRGAPRSAIAVSPGAVYVLEAHGRTLRAVAAGTGRVAQTQRAAGPVTAAAWSPFPIRIAYLAEVGGHQQLHDEWGTLSHDYLVDRHVAAVAPSWRWDSLAVAYVRADGRVAVHNATSGRNTVIPPNCGLRHPTALAFASTSGLLAIADRTRLRIVDTTGGEPDVCAAHSPGAPSIAWVRPHQLFVAAGTTLYRYLLLQPGLGTDTTTVPARITGLTAAPDGRRLALALTSGDSTRVVAAAAPPFSEQATPLHVLQLLLPPRPLTGPVALSWQ